MKSMVVARLAAGAAIAALLASATFARPAWAPAAEIAGQPVKVTTNGVTNTVTLLPGGRAMIASPGGYIVNGSWNAANRHLCLRNGMAQECWPYDSPFQAGQPVTLTSSCNAISTWLAATTNPLPAQPAQSDERGR